MNEDLFLFLFLDKLVYGLFLFFFIIFIVYIFHTGIYSIIYHNAICIKFILSAVHFATLSINCLIIVLFVQYLLYRYNMLFYRK